MLLCVGVSLVGGCGYGHPSLYVSVAALYPVCAVYMHANIHVFNLPTSGRGTNKGS